MADPGHSRGTRVSSRRAAPLLIPVSLSLLALSLTPGCAAQTPARASVLVLSYRSWWTPRTSLALSALLFTAAAAVVAWNAVLRRRMRARTTVIRVQLKEAQALRRQFEDAQRDQSNALSEIRSLQVNLLQAQEKLRYQATHDALTGLWNRGALLDLLHSELERSLRTRAPLGVLMLDIDHFKPINETHGHQAGDAVLREIGARLSHATRPYDVAGRYGGEEFLVVLPDCDREQTEGSAERIRAAIAAVPFAIAGSKTALTVSIGAAVALDCALTETDLLSLADLALYEARTAGRNCTVVRTSFQEEHAGTA